MTRFKFLLFLVSLLAIPSLFSKELKELKVLALIIASDERPLFIEQQKLWRSYMHSHPQIKCYFLKGDPSLKTKVRIEGDIVWTRTENSRIPGSLDKTILSLEALLPQIKNFDYVLRTNLSSFFIFSNLLEFLNSLPRKECYCGLRETLYQIPYGSGAGLILSQDLVKPLVHNQQFLLNRPISEELCLGLFFQNLQIPLRPSSCSTIEHVLDLLKIKNLLTKDLFHIEMDSHLTSDNPQDSLLLYSELINLCYKQKTEYR